MLLDRQKQAPAPGTGDWSLNLVALLAFSLGALLAVGRHATWQAPVENGQMLAGLVPFLPENPYHLYLVKLWSLLNQASALLLRAEQ